MTIKRMTWEEPGGDEDQRKIRAMKGIGREISTPFLSVPYSVEGSNVIKNIDDSMIGGSVKNRNEIADVIARYYQIATLKTARLMYDKNQPSIMQNIEISYNDEGDKVSPEVYR